MPQICFHLAVPTQPDGANCPRLTTKEMTKLQILIVDDEPLARARVRSFLGDNPNVEIAGECGNGIDALEQIRSGHPDIAFIDVQMPGCNGLEVMSELPIEQRPAIVLVTAHEKFAVEAFAAHAVDYLLKPFDRKRFHQALKRAIDHIRARRAEDLGSRIEGLLASSTSRRAERLIVKADGRIMFLKPDDILWIEAANNYCNLHLAGDKRLLLRETLSSIEKRLGSARFVRVNRSALVHIDQVQELRSETYGDYVVMLRNGTRLPLSRSLRGRLGKFVADPL
jgi:two-component system LytT family response regulator